MPKILSQAGNSLADVYDVEGSIAGIDQLDTRDLPIVHEMGHTVMSERMSGEIVRLSTGALAQNTAFDVILTSPPVGIYRVQNFQVIADVAARTSFCQISLRDVTTGREVPFMIWASADDVDSSVRIVENGAAVSTQTALRPSFPHIPLTATGTGQPRRVGQEIAFRGSTSGFGAGVVTIIALISLVSAEVPGVSSRGLPVPSW